MSVCPLHAPAGHASGLAFANSACVSLVFALATPRPSSLRTDWDGGYTPMGLPGVKTEISDLASAATSVLRPPGAEGKVKIPRSFFSPMRFKIKVALPSFGQGVTSGSGTSCSGTFRRVLRTRVLGCVDVSWREICASILWRAPRHNACTEIRRLASGHAWPEIGVRVLGHGVLGCVGWCVGARVSRGVREHMLTHGVPRRYGTPQARRN